MAELSRKQFLKITGLGIIGTALAGCGVFMKPASPEQIAAAQATLQARVQTPAPPAAPTIDNDELSAAQQQAADAKTAAEAAQKERDSANQKTAELQRQSDEARTPTPNPKETEPLITSSTSFENNPLVLKRATRLAEDFNLDVNEVVRRMAAIQQALLQAGITYGILDGNLMSTATNPQYTEGVIPNQQKNTWTANYSEAATAFVSTGGGTITDDRGLRLRLPNGVLDLSAKEKLDLVSPTRRGYPYLSQAYQVVCANRAGEDVLPPETPDRDLNEKIVVKPNAELQYTYVARGAWQGNGAQQKRTIGADWLTEQLMWGTGGGSNCGTGCGEVTLLLVQTRNDRMTGYDRNYITVAHFSAYYEDGQPVDYRAAKIMTEDYNQAGIEKVEAYLAKNVIPTWPATPTPTPTPKP